MTNVCGLCSKELKRNQKKFCSIKCARAVGNKLLGKVLHNKVENKYPMNVGTCLFCKKIIYAKNASFAKKNRKFCSIKCKQTHINRKTVWTDKRRVEMSNRISALFKDKKKSPEHIEKIRQANLGEKSHFWLGGLTEKNNLLRNGLQTKVWRKECFERDNYTCQDCGLVGGKLCVHHIINWSDNEKLRWVVSNGITLCWGCHHKRHRGADFWKRRLDKQNTIC